MKSTILIGLGGTGSRMVDQTVSYMSEDEREKVMTIALDTDVGDLQKLKKIDQIVQTSPNGTIWSNIKKSPGVKNWFPVEYDALLYKDMLIGAGQIRAVSRLAFYTAIKRGEINRVEQKIKNALQGVTRNVLREAKNVVIVSSLAGGTGSGSFLQMALLMREIFGDDIVISGYFMLPDILIENNKIRENEHATLRYNTYAAFKELNAILKINKSLYDIELEYRPQQKNLSISKEGKPVFDFVVLFDYENSDNKHLINLDAYEKQMSESIYHGNISTIADSFRSRIINSIREFVQRQSEAFYASCSVSRIIYPYDDLISYATYSIVVEDIDKNWLFFDNNFKAEYDGYLDDIRHGISREKPDRAKLFTQEFENIGNDENASGFQKALYNETRLVDEKGGSILNHQIFINALDEFIEKSIEQFSEYKEIKSKCTLQDISSDDIEDAKAKVASYEYNRKKFKSEIPNMVNEIKGMIYRQIVTRSCDYEPTESKEYMLYNWMVQKAMHPLATRYFLYKVIRILSEKLISAKSTIENSKKSIALYDKAFNIDNSPYDEDGFEYNESPLEVLEIISDMSMIDRVRNYLNSDLKLNNFISKYDDKYTKNILLIEEYFKQLIQKEVYEKLIEVLVNISTNYETLFLSVINNISELSLNAKNDINEKHKNDLGNIILYESYEEKEKLTKEVYNLIDFTQLNKSITKKIAKHQYNFLCNQIQTHNETELSQKDYENIIFDSYSSFVIEHTKVVLDIDIFKAVQKEGKKIGSYLQQLSEINKPWVKADIDDQNIAKFWGINDSINIKNNNINVTGNFVKDSTVSKYEIVYFAMFYNLIVSEIEKFSKNGIYFGAYHEHMINCENEPQKYITPHLDKRWHNPAILPDINPDVAQTDSDNTVIAFWNGLVNGKIYKDSKDLFTHRLKAIPECFEKDGKCFKGRWYDFYQLLLSQRALVNKLAQEFKTTKDNAVENGADKLKSDEFLKSLNTSKVLKYINELYINIRTDEEKKFVNELLLKLKEIIVDYIKNIYGKANEDDSKEYIQNYLKTIGGKLKELKPRQIPDDIVEFFMSYK